MSLPVVFRREAQDEMDEAYGWYERQRAGLGEEFLAAAQDVLDRIQENPESYALVYRDVRRGLTRRFPYAVYYQVQPERIIVLGVYHGRRNPRGWQERA
jgi:plasmid stabilization system protein ParE